jgi:hypothetical protein
MRFQEDNFTFLARCFYIFLSSFSVTLLEAVWQKISTVIYLKTNLYRYNQAEIDKCIPAICRTKNGN